MKTFGASVRGPAHAADGRANEDAWAQSRSVGEAVIVVSDGMGSKPNAAVGSRAACRAAIDALRQWRRFPEADTDTLLGLLHVLWRARVAPLEPSSCACTCLLAVLRQEGESFAAQLGDGVVLVRDDGGVRSVLERSSSSFTNETHALGITKRLAAWKKEVLPTGTRSIVLCTDGVADDLLPEKYDEFVGWLETDIGRQKANRRWRALVASLRGWPTPRHSDDKTIAVAMRGGVN
jgi:hypothetical protein